MDVSSLPWSRHLIDQTSCHRRFLGPLCAGSLRSPHSAGSDGSTQAAGRAVPVETFSVACHCSSAAWVRMVWMLSEKVKLDRPVQKRKKKTGTEHETSKKGGMVMPLCVAFCPLHVCKAAIGDCEGAGSPCPPSFYCAPRLRSFLPGFVPGENVCRRGRSARVCTTV